MSELKLAENLRELRTANEYSQQYVSEQIHLARQTYSLYENGKRIPDIRTVCCLAELYHVSVDALLFADLSASQIADAASDFPEEHVAFLSENSAIRLTGSDARMLMNYKTLPPDVQQEVREFVLFKKKRFAAKDLQ